MDFASEETNFPRIDINLCRQCIGKMKLNKSSGFDNVSTEEEMSYVFISVCFLIQCFNTVMCVKDLDMV